MRKILIVISLCLLLLGCKGGMNLPASLPGNYSVEVISIQDNHIASLLERKISAFELDVTSKDDVVLRIFLRDKIQINKNIYDIPWVVLIKFREGNNFKIVRNKD